VTTGQATQCRNCGSDLSLELCDLGMQPPSNYNLKPEELNGVEEFMPLRALVCESCWLVQLDYFEDAGRLFSDDYAYFSSFSTSWLAHAKAYAEAMTKRFGLTGDSFVVELASNDGYLLQYFKGAGMRVLGVEPSANVAQAAKANHGIDSAIDFFGVATAKALAAKHGKADLMAANNVLAHVPDIRDFVGGVPEILAPEGAMTFEFPHLLSLLTRNQFDTIYHEHFSYLSLLAVQSVLKTAGLRVFDVEEIPTHGGSLRVFCCHEGAAHAETPAVAACLATERAAGLAAPEVYRAYQARVDKVKHDLLKFLIAVREEGRTVMGYGAPAKGNTLLNYAGIRKDLMHSVVDRSPQKQGRFLPGTHLPVYAPEKIEELRPDYVVIMPWNLREEIAAQLAHIRDWGGKFVVAIPEIEIF
jgi:SAM-dependent methyltransferase